LGNLAHGLVTGSNVFVSGLDVNISVPASGFVLLQSTGGMQTSVTGAGLFAVVEVTAYVDGTIPQNGTRRRLTATNVSPTDRAAAYWSINQSLSLTPGTHNVKVAVAYITGNTNAVVSGVDGSLLQGTLSVTVLKN